MLAQKHALANYFLVWILFGHTFIALAQNAEVWILFTYLKEYLIHVFFSEAKEARNQPLSS